MNGSGHSLLYWQGCPVAGPGNDQHVEIAIGPHQGLDDLHGRGGIYVAVHATQGEALTTLTTTPVSPSS